MNHDSHRTSNKPPPPPYNREQAKASLKRLIDVYAHYLNACHPLDDPNSHTPPNKRNDER